MKTNSVAIRIQYLLTILYGFHSMFPKHFSSPLEKVPP
jgi:hypothetical protein